jgi:hypothetical protein
VTNCNYSSHGFYTRHTPWARLASLDLKFRQNGILHVSLESRQRTSKTESCTRTPRKHIDLPCRITIEERERLRPPPKKLSSEVALVAYHPPAVALSVPREHSTRVSSPCITPIGSGLEVESESLMLPIVDLLDRATLPTNTGPWQIVLRTVGSKIRLERGSSLCGNDLHG